MSNFFVNALLYVLGAFFVGLFAYGFFIVLFSPTTSKKNVNGGELKTRRGKGSPKSQRPKLKMR